MRNSGAYYSRIISLENPPKPPDRTPKMRSSRAINALAIVSLLFVDTVLGDPVVNATNVFTKSSKRGLVFIPNSNWPDDNKIWYQSGSDLTWYYNYTPNPSPALLGSGLEFVPMFYSAPASTSDTSFIDTVQSLISGGTKVNYVMTFNEPDGTSSTGGTHVDPKVAAAAWIAQVEPLKKNHGIKLGAPAVTGAPGGFTWLSTFLSACNGGCNPDFFPIHWYGDFGGLASHLGQVRGTYPNSTVWVTEYALNDAALSDTQSFFNSSAEYFDRLTYVTHYSYFGSFRSSVSNVGPNAAMLDQNGKLTDMGSWYLGGPATGNVPDPNYKVNPTTGKSGAAKVSIGSMWAFLVVGIFFSIL